MASYYDENAFIARYESRFALKLDSDWSYREKRLHILQKFLNGSIYDNLQPYYYEYLGGSSSGSYVPLSRRRPSVIYKIPKIIVDSAVSMLFGEGHFPIPRCDHENTTQFLQYITRKCDLKSVMLDAARKGSIGSVVVLVKVLDGKFYFEALHSTHLRPVFKINSPKTLEKLTEKKKVDGASLIVQGYDIDDDDRHKQFYVMREWTETREIYYQPYKVDKEKDEGFNPEEDKERSTDHDLGFVPAVWIKNLPKSSGIDGHSTFEDILDICIEIDYQLSQQGRMLKYNSDPTLVIKNPQDLSDTQLIKGLQPIVVDEKGDAKLLEITTGSTSSVIEYVKMLRELALEMVRGNRASPDKVHSAQSGEALKMLNFELIGLVDEMRLTYGEYGLLEIYCMTLKIIKAGVAVDYGEYMPDLNEECEGHIMIDWPNWYPKSELEKFNESKTLSTLLKDNVISHKTATAKIADEYNILDIEEEIRDIQSDIEQNQANDYDDKSKPVDRETQSVDRKE